MKKKINKIKSGLKKDENKKTKQWFNDDKEWDKDEPDEVLGKNEPINNDDNNKKDDSWIDEEIECYDKEDSIDDFLEYEDRDNY
ncbi:hypothetical protein KJ671_01155 [Patescibacteria group bacterium]|nr:hypothetical protein [Patescibacteria group bacterium]